MPLQNWIFVDESGCDLRMRKEWGWAPKGLRLESIRPVTRGPRLTFVGAVGLRGPVCLRTMLGSMNRSRFVTFIREALAPKLNEGDVVVLDNLPAHKTEKVVSLIEQRGAFCVFLPPYSPDLNPIELVWSAVKSSIRKASVSTLKELRQALQVAWRNTKTYDFHGMLRVCGYR